MRLLALLVLFAVLPTAELTEQVAHVVEHVLEAEAPDHLAHHDGTHSDEHGCTGLVHLCSCHQTQITVSLTTALARGVEAAAALASTTPTSLVDLTSPEPGQRPPIA